MRNFRITPAVLAVALTVFTMLTLAACSTTQPAGEQVDDAALTSKVKAKLTADPEVNPFNIDVDTDQGVVTLRGEVDDSETKAEAGKLARNTSGVRGLRNLIEVGDGPMETVPGTDAALVTAITARLAADDDVAAANIDVDAQDGLVTLSGTVKTSAARQEAERIARSVDGVRSVRNELKVQTGR